MQNLSEKIYGAIDIPKEAILNIPFVTIVGNNEILIENYKAVINYRADCLKINTKIGVLKISGNKIEIKYIKKDEISVIGTIKSVEYEE